MEKIRERQKAALTWGRRWLDGWRLTGAALWVAVRNWRFDLAAGLTFGCFGVLMHILSTGTATLDLLFRVSWGEKFGILGRELGALFGVGQNFLDWFLIFVLALIQGVLVALIALIWQKRRQQKRSMKADEVQSAGIVAGLAVLSAGCPSCGTSLLAPVLGMLFSGSSIALASVLSGLLFGAALVIALLTLQKVGKEAYVIMKSAKRRTRQKEVKT